MELFQHFKNQFTQFWRDVDPSTKLLVMLLGGVLVAAVVVAVMLNQKPNMSLLYGRLDEGSASQIVAVLNENNVTYELKNNGKDIYVEKNRVSETRLLLRERDLPKDGSGVGYEIFDKNQFGVTDFVQNIQHQRALEGELARTIAKIKGVEGARVHIVLPKERLFKKDNQFATATIFLKLAFDGALDSSQIQGIQRLVGSSVEGLKPKHVTVVDNYGNILAGSDDQEESHVRATNRMQMQKNVEHYYTQKAQTLLDTVLGKSGSIVRVAAVINFDRVEETQETFDPESAVVRSEVITTEKASGSSEKAKGAPGVQSNMSPGSSSSAENKETSQSSHEVINNRYEIDKTIRHIIKGAGRVEKVTISVFIKQRVALDEEGNPKKDAQGNLEVMPRSEEELIAFRDIIQHAIGFDESRGDKIVVKEVPFEAKEMPFPETLDASASSTNVNDYVRLIVEVIFSLIFLLTFRRLIKRRAADKSVVTSAGIASSGEAASERAISSEGGGDEEELESDKNVNETDLEKLEKSAFIEGQVGQVMEDYPSEAEQVIKNWVRDHEGNA